MGTVEIPELRFHSYFNGELRVSDVATGTAERLSKNSGATYQDRGRASHLTKGFVSRFASTSETHCSRVPQEQGVAFADTVIAMWTRLVLSAACKRWDCAQ